MDKIPSFKVNHILLQEGIYVSRVDRVGGEDIVTYDIRVYAPSTAPQNIADGAGFHTIEHIGATYFRGNRCKFHKDVIYFGPMGCLTGFYLILKGNHPIKEVWDEVKNMFEHVIGTETIPGKSKEECGRASYHNLSTAQDIATRYLRILYEGVTQERTQYPIGKVLFLCATKEEERILLSTVPDFLTAIFCTGIGKVNAAVVAAKMIEDFQPDYVVSFGFAGGMPKTGCPTIIEKGSIVCADKVFYHDVWCGSPNKLGQVQGFPAFFKCQVNEEITEFVSMCVTKARYTRMATGSVATGDSFVTRKEDVYKILTIDNNAVCVDMEAAAIAQVCHEKGIKFSAYKVISDMIGEGDQMEEYFKSVERYG